MNLDELDKELRAELEELDQKLKLGNAWPMSFREAESRKIMLEFALQQINKIDNVEYNRKAEVVPHIVAKWLDREEFNSASFDRIINDAFNNNGHHYIDDPEVRAWIKDNSAALKNALDNGHKAEEEIWEVRLRFNDREAAEAYAQVERGEVVKIEEVEQQK